MKNYVIALLLVSTGLFAFASETEDTIFNWKIGQLDKVNLVELDMKLLDESMLSRIKKDYSKKPLTIKFNSANLEQKMEDITPVRVWENKKENTQKYFLFSVDGSTYFVVFATRNNEIFDKFMLSSWNM